MEISPEKVQVLSKYFPLGKLSIGKSKSNENLREYTKEKKIFLSNELLEIYQYSSRQNLLDSSQFQTLCTTKILFIYRLDFDYWDIDYREFAITRFLVGFLLRLMGSDLYYRHNINL